MKQVQVHRPTSSEINLTHLAYNYDLIQDQVASRLVMPIIKANAYGHGLVPVGLHLQKIGAKQLGVAFLEEGIALRHGGIQIPILILGGIFEDQVEHFLHYDLEIPVSSIDKLNLVNAVASAKNTLANIHLKFDTGMERIGVHTDSAQEFLTQAVNSKHCKIKGIYSHLACADDPNDKRTLVQVEKFKSILSLFENLQTETPICHLANSGGVLNFPETYFDMVRPGIMLFGVYPDVRSKKELEIKPVMSLKSKISYFKVVTANNPVSYGATWSSPHDTRVVTIPIGYGDGFRRGLSNCGQVLIRGKKYPIIGKICMDQFMVNIGKDSVYNNDEVILFGKQGNQEIHVEELADLVNTIPYEILTGLTERIPRIHIS